jgi:nicotinate-nucleotide adenylyltransferase
MVHKRRIGIYGGTFDPVHQGHVDVARNVLQLFEIDEVVFVPALLAPHKLTRPVTSHLHRYAMLTLATQDDSQLTVSTFELEAANRRYTVDTIAHFQEQFGGTADLFFVMGADSWSEITTWREWERLLAMINHIVVTRPGYDLRVDHVAESVRERILDLRAPGDVSQPAVTRGRERIFITDVVMRDISATQIRRAASEGRFADLEQLVPARVSEYIRKYNLYRDGNEN